MQERAPQQKQPSYCEAADKFCNSLEAFVNGGWVNGHTLLEPLLRQMEHWMRDIRRLHNLLRKVAKEEDGGVSFDTLSDGDKAVVRAGYHAIIKFVHACELIEKLAALSEGVIDDRNPFAADIRCMLEYVRELKDTAAVLVAELRHRRLLPDV